MCWAHCICSAIFCSLILRNKVNTSAHTRTRTVGGYGKLMKTWEINCRILTAEIDSEDLTHKHTHSLTQILTSNCCYCCSCVCMYFFFFTCRTFWFSARTVIIAWNDASHTCCDGWDSKYFYFCANGIHTRTLWNFLLGFRRKRRQILSMIWMHLRFIRAWFLMDGQVKYNEMFFLDRTLNCFLECVNVLKCIFVVSLKMIAVYFLMHCNAISFLFFSDYLQPMPFVLCRKHLLVNCQNGKKRTNERERGKEIDGKIKSIHAWSRT